MVVTIISKEQFDYLMNESGLSGYALAKLSGLNKASISRYKSGKTSYDKMRIESLIELSKVYWSIKEKEGV